MGRGFDKMPFSYLYALGLRCRSAISTRATSAAFTPSTIIWKMRLTIAALSSSTNNCFGLSGHLPVAIFRYHRKSFAALDFMLPYCTDFLAS